jgi:acylphosphatase
VSAAVRRRVVVRGRVQGVFFRDSTRSRAEALGVAGWVRNRDDGSVEAAFEGDPEAVDAMLGFVRDGPGHAVVSEVESHEEPPTGERGFRVG